MNPSNEVISNGNPSDEDVNPGGAQEAVTQQEISQLFRELDAVKQALLDHQTQSKNQIKVLQSQIIDVQEYNAQLEKRIEELSSSASRRSNHRRAEKQGRLSNCNILS